MDAYDRERHQVLVLADQPSTRVNEVNEVQDQCLSRLNIGFSLTPLRDILVNIGVSTESTTRSLRPANQRKKQTAERI